MPQLRWTLSARDDLRSIGRWLGREAPAGLALDILRAIRARAGDLERFPHIGRPHGSGVRILRVLRTPYLIRYRIAEGEVQVIRVHHERENWHVEP